MIYLLSQILDRAAQDAPEQEAFRCEGESLTYQTLWLRANGLANHLIQQGVQRGDRIGIYLNKSLESAIAIYGTWKAGAAYVPLDPNAPLARLTYVVNHCDIHHLITHPSKRKKLSALTAAAPNITHIVGIPDSFELEPNATPLVSRCAWESLLKTPEAPAVNLVGKDLAYILYTSGSTGTPKGIMHTHTSGLSYAKLAASTYGLKPSDRISNHSPLHFDISTLGFFAGPLAMATTVIIPEAYTKLPASLSQLIQDEALTIWYSVPFALTQLLIGGVLSERDFSTLRWVLFAGEPWPTKYLYALMQQLPNARFSNIYGPTEVNQCMYYHVPPLETKIEGDISMPQEPTLIGEIWSDSEGLVVDEHDHPVSKGEPGELLVRTSTMMSGYWQRPDLNAKAFFHTEIAHQPAVFYRTGDLVRQQSNGQYQFIGRKDRQIKTRGYRVELDEIEATLVAHTDVEEAATYAIPYQTGSHQIGAAVTLKPNTHASKSDLQQYLSKRLPSYALPHQLTIVQQFPRTGTGKIDRRTLLSQTTAQTTAQTTLH